MDASSTGRITPELWDKQAAVRRCEQHSLLRKIQDILKAAPAPVGQIIDMFRLTSRASELFLQQPTADQRRLLQTVGEGELKVWRFADIAVRTIRNLAPFEQESYRKEMGKVDSGSELVKQDRSARG